LSAASDGRPTLWAVRRLREDQGGGWFDVVEIDVTSLTSRIVATTKRLWVTPARGDVFGRAPTMLVIDGAAQGEADGRAHIDVVDLDGGVLRERAALGPGLVRSPVLWRGHTLVEREAGGRATLVDVETGKVVAAGRPGLSPVALPSLLAVSTSTKDGAVRVYFDAAAGDGVVWRAGRAGVARPEAIAETKKGPVVVAWLDRGQSLPGELWAIGAAGGAALHAPPPREVVTVYGIVDDAALPAAKAVAP